MDQAGSNFFAHATANGAFANTKRDTIAPNIPTLCLPEDVGMSSETLARIDSIVKYGIKARVFPGCQVLVLKEGMPVYDKCFGNYTYESAQKVKPTTMYDLASLSKTTGTLLAIMKLYDNGELKLTDKASRYLTFLRGTGKENITITELLFHESGLPASLPFYRLVIEKNSTPPLLASTNDTTHTVRMGKNRVVGTAFQFKEEWVSKIPSVEYTFQVSDSFYVNNRFHDAAMQMIADTPLKSKTYLYSCVNFILLKEIVETISGTSMDVFLEREFYAPLKLNNMGYLPLRTHKKEDVVPTLKKDFLRNGVIQGYVHDPDAAFLGGVSGNAGLFASARDVATVYQMLLNKGEMNGKRYLSAETIRLFTTTTSANGRRGLGYDKPVPANPKHSPCCISAPPVVYGHTGYTGTCCWVDPVNRLVYVFLSNRTYPNDGVNKLAKIGIRTRIQEVIYQSMKK
jgi:CubicO group peptidase (beta-lactamase class C family)